MQLSLDDLWSEVRRVKGAPIPGVPKLFAIMRDEMALLPAFLQHYRTLGFEQFLIFDDGSIDGSSELLEAQPDVVLYRSERRYSTPLTIAYPDGELRKDRFGIWLKAALPHVEAPGEVVAYFDADEFLILPDNMKNVGQIIEDMSESSQSVICASVVEFFPETVSDLEKPMPGTPAGLFDAYPYFEPEALVRLKQGEQPDPFGISKTNRLFEIHEIGREKASLWRRLRGRGPKKRFNRSPRHKLPFIRRDAETWQVGSHYASVAPAPDKLLTIAHFVFTAEFAAKIDRAREWRAHTESASKYDHYAELLDVMRERDGSFLSERSVRYEGPWQLRDAGLMAW